MPGEKIITEDDDLKDFYVVARGTVTQVFSGDKFSTKGEIRRFQKEKAQREMEKQGKAEANPESPKEGKKKERKVFKRYGPGTIFGELSQLTKRKWRRSTVFALEESALIGFSNNQIARLIKVTYNYTLIICRS